MSRYVLVGALLLAGCTPGADDVAAPEPTVACPARDDVVDRGGVPLPANVTPTAVVDCVEKVRLVPGDGEWLVQVHRRATDVARLVALLREPAERVTGAGCTTELRGPFTVHLMIDGRLVPVKVPLDRCGHPRIDLSIAYTDLHWTETAREPVRRKRSEAAVRGGV